MANTDLLDVPCNKEFLTVQSKIPCPTLRTCGIVSLHFLCVFNMGCVILWLLLPVLCLPLSASGLNQPHTSSTDEEAYVRKLWGTKGSIPIHEVGQSYSCVSEFLLGFFQLISLGYNKNLLFFLNAFCTVKFCSRATIPAILLHWHSLPSHLIRTLH